MKNKLKVTAIMFTLVAFVLITIGTTLAIFTYSATGDTLNKITVGGITFHYKEIDGKGRGISITDAMPVDSNDDAKISDNYFNFKITSTTTGGLEIPYVVTARMNIGSDEILGDIIDIYLTDDNNNPTELFNGELKKYNELEQYDHASGYTEKVIYTDTVTSSDYEKNFRLRMWIDQNTNLNTGNGTSDYNNKTFSITVNVNAIGSKTAASAPTNGLLRELILADNMVKTGPIANQLQTVSTTEQSGLYEMTTTNGYGGTGTKTYYFRGNVTNNVVKFADKTWRVIRVNEDGTVRVILDSVIEGENATYQMNTSSFGENANLFYSNSDIAKVQLESWYNSNFTEETKERIATGNYFCETAKAKPANNDYQSWTSNTATLYSSYTPDLNCPIDTTYNKQYVSSSIGMITYDEAILAGNYYDSNNEYNYLYKGLTKDNKFNYWTMSPAGIDQGIYYYVFMITTSGNVVEDYVDNPYYLRPVINLKADTMATKDENGYYVVDLD